MKFHDMKRLLAALLLVGVFLGASAVRAETIFVSVTGQNQGPFKGDAVQKGVEGKIAAVKFRYGAGAPRDAMTGMATGRLQHRPVVISKLWSAASPQFFQALLSNENLPQVVIDFFAPDSRGMMSLTHRIKLTNARVADVAQSSEPMSLANASAPLGGPQVQLEEISLVFQSIQIEDSVNGITVTSDPAVR